MNGQKGMLSCHIARHTFCARLCKNGTNIKLIQQIMGHSDIHTTMDIYAEVTKAKAHSAFQDLNEEDVLQGESFNLGSEKDLIQIRFLKITFVN